MTRVCLGGALSAILPVLLLSLPAKAAPGAPYPPPGAPTGQLIVRLYEMPPPPRLFRISSELSGQYRRGGRRTPYLLVQPKGRRAFKVPPSIKPLIAWVEPEIYMYTRPVKVRVHRSGTPLPGSRRATAQALRSRGIGRPGIGKPAKGSRSGPESLQIPSSPSTPNDPHFSYQWGFQEINFGVRVPSARRYSKGAGVTVGIVDSGVRQSLSDLLGTSFLPPWDALTTRPGGIDDNGHGSHVCGTIAQTTDNRIGCAGIAPAARILAVKALDANGRGTNFTIATGIRYAVDQGCQVINLSVGGSPSKTLADAVAYANSKEVLLICSSGNGGQGAITYPAAYNGTLSVGAIEATGSRANFSQYGPGLGIVAPGVDILQQTLVRGRTGYYYFSGTSMAAPHVSGVAALVKSLRPSLTRAELKLALMNTATDLGRPGVDPLYGSGLVNALLACEKVAGSSPPSTPPTSPPVTPVPPTEPPQPVPGADLVMMEVLALFNRERRGAGLPPVVMEARLNTAALAHARDMHGRGIMSHTGGDGSNPGQRMSRAGYPWRTWGEIVAMVYPDAASVVRAWMASTGHRNIILGAQFTECGIAKDGAYWTAVWGRR